MSHECVGTLLLNIRGVFLIQVKDKSLAYNVFEQEVHKSKSGVYFSHFFFSTKLWISEVQWISITSVM